MRNWGPTVALIALLVPAAAVPQTKTGQSGVYEELNLFGEAFERIRQDAVEPVTDGRLIETAIAGMLASLDPQSVYMNETEYKASQAAQNADAGSIGLALTLDSGQLKVVSPRDGSPSAKSGIKPGETIFAIDKEPVFDLTLTEIEQKLRGPVDSEVTLTMRIGSDAPTDVTLKRSADKLVTVGSHLESGNIGYIRIGGFDDTTHAALTAAAQELQQQAGSKLIGYILDLRNNPGGDFDVAVTAADDFLNKGDIAIVKRRNPANDKHIAATPGDIANGLPIVALVNGGTGREAELVAGALQDNHRAILVGSKTFGESAIESIIPLDGNGAIRLTTARFVTPSGRAIQGKGIDPDLTVAPLKLERLAQGFGRREADLRGALKNTDPTVPLAPATPVTPATPPNAAPKTGPGAATTPPGAATTPPGASDKAASSPPTPPKPETKSAVATPALGSAEDEQLTQAIDVLRGLALVTARNGR